MWTILPPSSALLSASGLLNVVSRYLRQKKIGYYLGWYFNVQVNILDSRRSLNINILLRQFRSPHEDLIGNIVRGDGEKIGVERLRALLKNLPEDEELKKVEAFTGSRSQLGSAEQFCLDILSLSK